MKKTFLIVINLIFCCYFSYSQNGILDLSFNSNGKFIYNASTISSGKALVVQQDGKIILAGMSEVGSKYCFTLIRLYPDGSFDASFGNNGVVTTSFSTSSSGNSEIFDITIQADGKIIAVGYSYDNITQKDFAIARYNTDGSLDNSFSYDGKIVVSNSTNNNDVATCLVVRPNGKILVGGYGLFSLVDNFIFLQLNSDGSFDSGFGSNGIVIDDPDNCSLWQVKGLALQGDGKFLACGYGINNSKYLYAIKRYNSNGTEDVTFSANGVHSNLEGIATSIKIKADKEIIVAGYLYEEMNDINTFGMVQLDSTGLFDNNFGTDGIVMFNYNNSDDEINAMQIQIDGKILVAGRTKISNNFSFVLGRFLSNGTADNSFGNNGFSSFTIGGFSSTHAYDIAIQPDGKIVMIGDGFFNGDNKIIAARFTSGINMDVENVITIDNFTIFPNPITNFVAFTCSGNSSVPAFVNIFNAMGCLVYQSILEEGNNVIDFSEYKTGTYYINIINSINSGQSVTKKMIKY